MTYSLLQLTLLFFSYSFLGWCAEVCSAAFHHKKFVNRGFVNGPLCPIYGFGGVLFAVFLSELTGNFFFLFLGGMIISTVLEYSTGLLLETFFHEKLWDYSKIRFNVGGYICLRYSLLWGLFAVLNMLIFNPLLCNFGNLIPHPIRVIALWVLTGLLACDFLTTAMTVLGVKIQVTRLQQLSDGIQRTSHLMENALTKRILSRMQKSFPAIHVEELAAKKPKSTVFAEGCSFYKLVSLFLLGAFLGDITETIFCYFTMGRLMSRSSVVYGPFSIVWGLGCALLTAFLYRYRNKSEGYIFIAGTVLGGAYEYICSVFTELVFGTIFWDYSGFSFNLGGRINLLYCFFWGIAAVVWLKLIYPFLSRFIEKTPKRFGTIFCNCMIIFMIFNMAISSLALARYTERNTESADTAVDVSTKANPSEDGSSDASLALNHFLDTHFPDERMERIYPNAKIVE